MPSFLPVSVATAVGICLLTLAPLTPVAAAPALPEEVAQALEAGECRQLMRLNRRYWRQLAELDAPATRAAAQALEAAILAQPHCGRAEGQLVAVYPLRGVNLFDPRQPIALGEDWP